ncbi:cytochrome P450 [Rhizobium sp. YJ-22]|uniref:cytochrome P450 n=1 Tax=Rhizobium sp. YJ-22 TaxID=3037556 RepID=UPI00241228B7|nr:cytochrome P450 [Rhizobium sp. YJ-22]MDG3579996.1 cytochrome P450 [Rhizobium sp. YJ-22]
MAKHLDIQLLPTTADFGFSGGRDNFRAFCRRVFSTKEPRFLRTPENQLVVFRHADLTLFGTAPEVGNVPIGRMYPNRFKENASPERLPGWEIGEVIASQVFTFNPPLHGPARRLLLNWLGPKQVSQMEEPAREVAREIIFRIRNGETVDLVHTVADAVVVGFWSKLLRLTDEETMAIGRCAHEMTRLFHAHRSREDLEVLDQAFAEYARILDQASIRGMEEGDPAMLEIAARLKELDFPDDPHEVGLVPKSVGAVLAGNLVDGFHTAALAAANTFHALLQNPEALASVLAAPKTLPRAIAEALRLEPPVLTLNRYILRDFHFDGLVLPAGNKVVMMWAAGNHDPSVFPEPERFDMGRPQTGLTTFGSGIHICPGRYVGVMLTRVLLEEFAAQGVELRNAEAPAEWIPDHFMNQLKVFPVTVNRTEPGG